MNPALRLTTMRAIFNVSVESDGQSHKTVSTNHYLFEEKGEPKRYRTEALLLNYQPNALPLGQTGCVWNYVAVVHIQTLFSVLTSMELIYVPQFVFAHTLSGRYTNLGRFT